MRHSRPLTGSGPSVVMAEDVGVGDVVVVVALLTMKQQELLWRLSWAPPFPDTSSHSRWAAGTGWHGRELGCGGPSSTRRTWAWEGL